MFAHKYFLNQQFRGLKIKPNKFCINTMRSYDILQKEINNEYILIYKEEEQKKNLLSKLTKPLTLSFYIFCEDLLLLNYSDFTFDDMNYGFLLTNRNSKEKTLHKEMFISDSEKILLISNYNTLNEYCKSEEENIVLTINDLDTGKSVELFKGSFKLLKSSVSFSDLIEIGSFEIVIGESSIATKCYAVEQTSKKLFGILELTIEPNSLTIEGISYTATLGSKSVVWRYHIINREQVAYKDFKIYSGKNLLPIKKEILTTTGNGEKAYLIESEEPILISDQYEDYFEVEFIKEDLKTGQLLSKKRLGLPVPEVNKIKISKTKNAYEAYSDMYIYI